MHDALVRVALRAPAASIAALWAAVAVANATVGVEPTRLPQPSFPAPATAPANPEVAFRVVTSRIVGVDVSARTDRDAPSWAPKTFDGKPLARAIRQPGTVFLLYGDEPTVLVAANARTGATRYAFDLSSLTQPPAGGWIEPITWARERAGVLFVSTSHLTYADQTRLRNAYVSAISLSTRKLLWRSPALVANARTFVLMENLVIAGYGFTAEPDFVYALDRRSGAVVGRLAVPNAPERIRLHGDTLTVRTYDRRLELRLDR